MILIGVDDTEQSGNGSNINKMVTSRAPLVSSGQERDLPSKSWSRSLKTSPKRTLWSAPDVRIEKNDMQSSCLSDVIVGTILLLRELILRAIQQLTFKDLNPVHC